MIDGVFIFMKKIALVTLSVFIALGSAQVHAGEQLNRMALPLVGGFVPSETLLDNTEHGTTDLTIPGWVNSDKASDRGFGVVFTTGSSRYLISPPASLFMRRP